ncbi:hypothetical protein [Enterococcus malodoratus]|uniref:hypothetical protein n=1 Tax=Enterococcus malodoratus TaxID=71451 RepID=UPI0022E3788E|nr:hypothetical protein [Enterococcus malodoratus]
MHTVNIYGESIVGEEIEYLDQPYKNIIIVEDSNGDKHVIHRETIDRNRKRKPSRAGVRFDLFAWKKRDVEKVAEDWLGHKKKLH